jgi:hypothetical protein
MRNRDVRDADLSNRRVPRWRRLERQQPATALGAAFAGVSRFSAIIALLAALLTIGCEAEEHKFREPHEIGDKVTDADLESFLQVVDELPNKKLPPIPVVFKSPPSWDEQRTLPVNELVRDETDDLEKQWNDETISRSLAKNRALQKALRRQHLSMPQFVGLMKTIGVSLTRNAMRPDQDLHQIIEQGKKRLERLRNQMQRFNQLKPDERHVVLTTAVWITRIDRARRLIQVPPENRAMAHAHFDRLKTIFPAEFLANPFDSIADQIEELGMSFEEDRRTGLDAEIEWKESDALRGTDRPDSTVREAGTAPASFKPSPQK